MLLDNETCFRALTARDVRFDGVFFVGVTTTGIYCRPVCTARTPGFARCRFFPNAALAEREGFRPCLRCRPELAPGHAPVDAVGNLARRAAARIEAGALNDGRDLEQLAQELRISSRQLRRAIRQEFGVSPVELAQTNRLLLAKRLLAETSLPMIDVALASGFASVRRFNALFRDHYGLAPSQVRRSRCAAEAGCIRLTLAYRPPLAWRPLLEFLAARGAAGVECTTGDSYARTVCRFNEIFQGIDLIRQAFAKLPEGELAVKVKGMPEGEVVSRVEQPRGECLYYLKATGRKYLDRLRIRTPTFANIAPLLELLPGCELADVPVLILTIDPCISCTER